MLDGFPIEGENIYSNFDDWWNEWVIVDHNKSAFSRKDLILNLANKDGGAHVDPKLDQDYANLTRNNSVGWTGYDGIKEFPVTDIELYSVRQIAYELLHSLQAYENTR